MREALFPALVPALAALLAVPWAARVLRRAQSTGWALRVAVWLCLAKALRGLFHTLAWAAVLALGEAMSRADAVRALDAALVGALLGYAGPKLARRDARARVPCFVAAMLILGVCAFDAVMDPRMSAGTVASVAEAGLLLWASLRAHAARIKLESPNS